MEQLINYTEKLIFYLDVLEQVFLTEKSVKDERAFFEHVQVETEPIFTMLETWNEAVLLKITRQELYFPTALIASTKGNMQALVMHSYYQDVRKRRYMEINQTCFYVFSKLLGEMQREKRGIN